MQASPVYLNIVFTDKVDTLIAKLMTMSKAEMLIIVNAEVLVPNYASSTRYLNLSPDGLA